MNYFFLDSYRIILRPYFGLNSFYISLSLSMNLIINSLFPKIKWINKILTQK